MRSFVDVVVVMPLFFWLILLASHPISTLSFINQYPAATPNTRTATTPSVKGSTEAIPSSVPSVQLRLSSSNNDQPEYSRDVRLREEAESPFRKVRYFLYLNLAGGALSSLFISVTRIAAAASGINTELMDESVRNAVIDVAGLIGVGYFWRQDSQAEESRLKRATKGAELAKLNVRASKALLLGDIAADNGAASGQDLGTFTTTLAQFRRQRGIEKRVVLAAGGADRIQQVLQEAEELQSELADNDLVVVPVVMPAGVPPDVSSFSSPNSMMPANVALPVNVGNNWKRLMEEEAEEAKSQGVDIETEGFCVILKKNGRVGQRTRGIFLNNLVGNIVARKEAGMDVNNI
jgi:Low psii accumulation1 / Rep27